jgi:hypothetical protein
MHSNPILGPWQPSQQAKTKAGFALRVRKPSIHDMHTSRWARVGGLGSSSKLKGWTITAGAGKGAKATGRWERYWTSILASGIWILLGRCHMINYCFRLRSFPAACGDGLPRRCLQANIFDDATGSVPIRLLQETGANPPADHRGQGNIAVSALSWSPQARAGPLSSKRLCRGSGAWLLLPWCHLGRVPD